MVIHKLRTLDDKGSTLGAGDPGDITGGSGMEVYPPESSPSAQGEQGIQEESCLFLQLFSHKPPKVFLYFLIFT